MATEKKEVVGKVILLNARCSFVALFSPTNRSRTTARS